MTRELPNVPGGSELETNPHLWDRIARMPPEKREALLAQMAPRIVDPYIPHVPHPPQMVFLGLNYEREVFYGGAAGGGKSDSLLMAALQYAMDTTTPVATPSGWSTIGDLQVGDEVFDERGQPCTILAKSPVYETGDRFRVILSDGTELIADGDHLWAADTFADRLSLGRGLDLPQRLVTTREMARTVHSNHQTRTTSNWSIPIAAALALPIVDLPLDPYLLGAWLGDGSKRDGTMSGIDPETLQEFRDAGYRVTPYTGAAWHVKGLRTKIEALGIRNNKHIPAAYLRASLEQRLALLQGLMDTDGTVDSRWGIPRFSNTNRLLIDAVAELVSSLGWMPRVFTESYVRKHSQTEGLIWHVTYLADRPVFRLPRKLERQTQGRERKNAHQRRWRIVTAVEPLDTPIPVQCITVDSPSHLFLAGRSMVPTHNCDVPGYAALILRKTFKDLTLPGAIMDRANDWLQHSPAKRRNGGQLWEFPTGVGLPVATLSFGHLMFHSATEQYRSAEFQFVGIDELTQFEERTYEFMFSRIRRPALPCEWCPRQVEQIPDAPRGFWRHKELIAGAVKVRTCEKPAPRASSIEQYQPSRYDGKTTLFDVPLRMRSACVDEGDVLTETGWKPIQQVVVGERVYSLDPRTGEMQYKPVTATHSYDHDGPLVRVRTDDLYMSFTPEHRVCRSLLGYPRHTLTPWRDHEGDWIDITRASDASTVYSTLVQKSRHATEEHFTGKVFCLTVADNETFILRQQNSIHVTGNSNPGGIGHPVTHGEVFTPQGFRNIREMRIGDPVFTLTAEGALVETRVEQVHHTPYDGEIVKVSARGLNISCTPDHRIAKTGGVRHGNWTRSGEGQLFSVLPFQDLPGQATILRSAAEWQGKPLEKVTLDLMDGRHVLDQPLTLTGLQYVALLGWFLSEGCTTNRARFDIAQTKEPQRSQITALLDACGFTHRWDKTRVQIHSKEWACHFAQFGLQRFRYIPDWVKAGDREHLRTLLTTMMAGDGHWVRPEGQLSGWYYTTSERLADDFAEIAFKLGYVIYQKKRQRDNREGLSYEVSFKTVKSGGTEILTGQHRYAVSTETKRRSDVTREHFIGTVYCLGVPDTHVMILRQDGSTWVSGNSWVRDRFVDARLKRPGCRFVPAKLTDNPSLDQESYRESLAHMGRTARLQLEEGQWDVVDENSMLKRHWFTAVEDWPKQKAAYCRYWDLAATAPAPGKTPDWTVGALLALVEGVWFLVDLRRTQSGPADVERLVLATAHQDIERVGGGFGKVKIALEQEPGSSGVNTIATYRKLLAGFPFEGDRPSGPKEERARPLAVAAENDNFKILTASWNRPFLDEAEAFPYGVHDDQVDAVTGAMKMLVPLRRARLIV